MTGEQYRETRKSLDLTQQQLAAEVGVAISTIQAREQHPEKEVSSEAEMAIGAVEEQILRRQENEKAAAGAG